MKHFYLNALGINNSIGQNKQEVYQSLFVNGHSDTSEYALLTGRKTQTMPITSELPELPKSHSHFSSRNNRLLLQAVLQIESEINTFIKKYSKARVGIVLGTSTSGIAESEKSFTAQHTGKRESGFQYYRQEISDPSEFLAAYLEIESPHYTVSTACTSSAKVFIEGQRLIDSDICDAVIVGGVDTLVVLKLCSK